MGCQAHPGCCERLIPVGDEAVMYITRPALKANEILNGKTHAYSTKRAVRIKKVGEFALKHQLFDFRLLTAIAKSMFCCSTICAQSYVSEVLELQHMITIQSICDKVPCSLQGCLYIATTKLDLREHLKRSHDVYELSATLAWYTWFFRRKRI